MTSPTPSLPAAIRDDFRPACVQRTGKECRDCVECLSIIPGGRTCASCVNVRKCVALGMTDPEHRFCDYAPSIYTFAARTPPEDTTRDESQ